MDLLGSIIAASPCPPLPIQVKRIDNVSGLPIIGYANSHHILMQAYIHAMNRNHAKDNEQREITQKALTAVLNTAFCELEEDPEKIYNSCTTFTRAYLHAFMPNRDVLDARFASYSDVASDTYNNNPIVRSSCEHLAGLIFYDESGTVPYDTILTPFKTIPFSDVLREYSKVHIARNQEIPKIHSITEE